MQVKLGDLVRDSVNGFEGIALARLEGLYEATQYRIHSNVLTEKGGVQPCIWIEEGRLQVVENRHVPKGFLPSALDARRSPDGGGSGSGSLDAPRSPDGGGSGSGSSLDFSPGG